MIVGLAVCAASVGATLGSESRVGSSCSDSSFKRAVSSPLAALDTAVLRVDAGHGDVDALAAAAPELVSAARLLRTAATTTPPCRARLLKARRLVLVATRDLLNAGRQLELLTDAIRTGKPSSALESQFLTSIYAGSGEFQEALASLRRVGVRLVSATDGKGIFTEAGCGMCHTLAAAGATGTVGPNLDVVKPSKAAVINAVTLGQGVMFPFDGELSVEQIKAVAEFTSQNAGK